MVEVFVLIGFGFVFGQLRRAGSTGKCKFRQYNGRIGLFLLVGFCGGFTTFSTFIQDNYKLIASQQLLMPALYTGLSVVVGYVALYIGLVLAR